MQRILNLVLVFYSIRLKYFIKVYKNTWGYIVSNIAKLNRALKKIVLSQDMLVNDNESSTCQLFYVDLSKNDHDRIKSWTHILSWKVNNIRLNKKT